MVTALQDNDDISSASGSSTSRAASVELSCGSPSDSDSEATCSSQVDEVASSPNVTPSELLFEEDDQIFDLGLDLEYGDQAEEKEENAGLSFARLQRLQDYNNSRDAFSNTMDFSPFKRSHQYHHPHHHHHHRQGLSDPSEEKKHWYEDMMDEDEDEDMLFGETHSFMDESSDFDDDEQDDDQDEDDACSYPADDR